MNRPDLTQGLGVEITLKKPVDFVKVLETLTRIGVPSYRQKRLYQTCHILHKQGRYWIMMFKELFALDGKPTDFSEEDKARRNTIVALLQDWKLLEVVDPAVIKSPRANLTNIKVLTSAEKKDWELVPKYIIGKKRKMNGSDEGKVEGRERLGQGDRGQRLPASSGNPLHRY